MNAKPPLAGSTEDLQTAAELDSHDVTNAFKRCAYQLKDAIDSIHAAFHSCDGSDPFDGLPLDGKLLTSGQSHDHRCPTVCPVSNDTIADFEILSLQTKNAKGTMSAETFIAHCRAVVAHVDTTSAARDEHQLFWCFGAVSRISSNTMRWVVRNHRRDVFNCVSVDRSSPGLHIDSYRCIENVEGHRIED